MSASSRQVTPLSATSARRTPVQRRSRERVQRILLAAEQVVVAGGVDALTTRAVAARARVPIGTLYQYFADRDAIIAALIDRHVSAMDARIAGALAQLPRYSVRSIVESTVAAYREGYRQRPSYVVLWFQGRVNAEIASFVRERDDVLARQFHTFAIAAGLLEPSTEPFVLSLAFELADRFMEVAYRHDLDGEDRIVKEGIEVVAGHLERYATPAGIDGIDAGELAARWQAPVLEAPAVGE
ncbi:MAG TPA: TetR/AcrR family transcriptional regulator [Solirubrobacteraceae bacterium]|nr:TetR/AcrR family transcriptional regulator [Solirubrobacteraceae bacterium]